MSVCPLHLVCDLSLALGKDRRSSICDLNRRGAHLIRPTTGPAEAESLKESPCVLIGGQTDIREAETFKELGHRVEE